MRLSLLFGLTVQSLFSVVFSFVVLLFFLLSPEDFLNGFYVNRSIPAKTFKINVFDEGRQWCFPGFWFLIGDFPELLGIHPQFPGHLNVSIRKMISLSNINPYLILVGYPLFLGHSSPPIFYGFQPEPRI